MNKNNNYLPIIGLEVHIELKTESKMFCGCSANHFQVKPNTHTCPVCLGLAGALPVPNKKAIEWCLTAGLALNCQIPLFSKFDRKNYFYPDLAKGYQISQYDLPFAVNGKLNVTCHMSHVTCIRIRRVHLEEDSAKMIHQSKKTLIDFNRSGVSLLEIVSEADINSPVVAKAYLKKLQQIIRYLGISDCDMEKGSMRCEANVSLRRISNFHPPAGGPISKELPDYKIEIKNLNSFRFVEKALEYEIKRQKKLLRDNKKLTPETRGWDEVKQITFPQRVKESAADYRYFPEPDIPPIKWEEKEIKKLRDLLPELPDEKIKRFVKNYQLTEKEAQILSQTREASNYFEKAVKAYEIKRAREIASLIINKRIDINKYSPLQLIKTIKAKKKTKIKNREKIAAFVQIVIKENQKAVIDFQKGKKEVISFLIGQVMKKSQGKADAQLAGKILRELLKK